MAPENLLNIVFNLKRLVHMGEINSIISPECEISGKEIQ